MTKETSGNLAALTDEALMLHYKEGDVAAFDQLFKRYKDGLYQYVVRYLGDRSAAEDVFGDVWERLVRASDRYQQTAKFKTYLFTLTRNRMIDHYRSQSGGASQLIVDKSEAELGNLAEPSGRGPEQDSFLKECLEFLKSGLLKLPEAQREVLLLYMETDMTLEHIGQVIDSNRETVKSRLRYARDKLKEIVPEECYES